MKFREVSKALTISMIFLMVFINFTAILDAFSQKFKVKPPAQRGGIGIQEPLAKRTRTTEVQLERPEIAQPVYTIEFRQDLASNVGKYIQEFNTDLYNALTVKMIAYYLLYFLE